MNQKSYEQSLKKASRGAKKPMLQAGPVARPTNNSARKGTKPNSRSQQEEKSLKSVAAKPKALPHRYKTQMCKMFAEGKKCEFGQNCNFAHGEHQL